MDNKKLFVGLVILILIGLIWAGVLLFNGENGTNLNNSEINSSQINNKEEINNTNNSLENSTINSSSSNKSVDKLSGQKGPRNSGTNNVIKKGNNNDQKSKPWQVFINSKSEAVNSLKSFVSLEKGLKFGNNAETLKEHITLDNGNKFVYYKWRVPVYNTTTNKITGYYTIGEDGIIDEYF